MTDESKPDETERNEQIAEPKQPEHSRCPRDGQAEPAEETQKPKRSKLAVLSIVCLVAAFAVLVIYLKSGEASIPLAVEKMLFPAGAVVLAIALVAGVIALVMIKTSGGALSGRRLALLGIIVPIVSAVAFLRTSPGTWCECVPVSPAQQCRTNILRLAEMISEYRGDNDGQFPRAQKWCDILLEQIKVDESLFACPLAKGARCSYSLNKYAAEAGSDLPQDMVLLFESAPGWNQVGGPELFIAPHETRRGTTGCVVFANGKSRFVFKDNVGTMNWKGDQDSEDSEDEDEEEE